MRYIAYALATAACLTVGPVVAGSAETTAPVQLAQVELNIGAGEHRERSGVEVRERSGVEIRDRDRERNRATVIRRGDRAERCRMITVRTHRPNGTVIVRQTRRCD